MKTRLELLLSAQKLALETLVVKDQEELQKKKDEHFSSLGLHESHREDHSGFFNVARETYLIISKIPVKPATVSSGK